MNRDAALGVFDSGLGGLTVVHALRQALPNENIVYLGDTARVPYGTKGAATVIRYALGCTKHLVDRGVKAVVIACNTVSAVAPERLRIDFDVPVLGVIDPGARAAVEASITGRIGVLATTGTVASGAYARAVQQYSTRAEVISQAAPLLVPLAEEGWTDGEVPNLIIDRYLTPLKAARVDTLVLGCTHYPLLKSAITARTHLHLGPTVKIIDSAQSAALDVAAFLRERRLHSTRTEAGSLELRVTDLPATFMTTAARFLGESVPQAQQVDL
jgi:glutamate racemase